MGIFNWFSFGKKQETVKSQDTKSGTKTNTGVSKTDMSKNHTPTKPMPEVKSAFKASSPSVSKSTSTNQSNDSLLTDPLLSPLSPISPFNIYDHSSPPAPPPSPVQERYCAPSPSPVYSGGGGNDSYSDSCDSGGDSGGGGD